MISNPVLHVQWTLDHPDFSRDSQIVRTIERPNNQKVSEKIQRTCLLSFCVVIVLVSVSHSLLPPSFFASHLLSTSVIVASAASHVRP